MRSSGYWLRRRTVDCLVILLAVPLGATAHALPGQQAAAAPAQSQAAPQSSTAPDSQAGPQTSDPPAATPQSSTAQPQQNGATAPVGTAAAPYEKGIGVAASRPAGAVIAPAKQRRTRSILIKVGLIVAAGVAIGTVVALSSASPSTAH
jgi:glucose/arabinose dehydrogenase